MNNLRRLLPVAVLALVALALAQGEALSRSRSHSRSRAPSGRPAEEWSRTSPPVNVTHIFEGEVNRRGMPTGFHSRPGGQDPPNARVTRIVDRPNRAGDGERFRGPSGQGFTIEGYFQNGRINSAYPIYTRD
jgi:hypothetical protein